MAIEVSTAPVVAAADLDDLTRFPVIDDGVGQATTYGELKVAITDYAGANLEIGKDYRLDVSRSRRGSVWPGKNIISMFQLGHGFEALTGGSDNIAETADPMYGPNYVRLTSDGTGAYKIFRKYGASGSLPTPLDLTGKHIAIAFSISDLDRLNAIQLFLGDSTMSNFLKYNNLKGSQSNTWFKAGEKVVMTFSLKDGDITGAPDQTNIEGFQLRFNDDASGPVTMNVYGMWLFDSPTQALASVSWDDGYIAVFDEGFRYMSRYLMPSTVYMIPQYMDANSNRLTKVQLLEMQEKGWEIAGHHIGNNLKAIDEATLHTMFQDNIEWGRANGFENISYAYPGGEFGPLDSDPDVFVEDIAKLYYENARTINSNFHETLPVANPHRLRVRYITSSQTPAEVIADIDDAIANNEWIHLPFHNIVAGAPTVSTEYNRGDFEQIIDHLASTGIEVVTVADAMRRNSQ